VKFRVQGRNKQAVMDALVSVAELDLPKASVQAEVGRLLEGARRAGTARHQGRCQG
jgi:trigger factor